MFFPTVVILSIFTNPTLSAVINSNALPPKDPTSSYFAAVFYTRKSPTYDTQYFLVTVRCGALIISPKWLLTSMNCHIHMSWKVLIGVPTIPRHGIYKENTYKILRVVESLETLLTLVEMERKIEINTKPAIIGDYTQQHEGCYVASWMQRDEKATTKKLHCTFNVYNSTYCLEYVGNSNYQMTISDSDICLLQKKEDDPVKLCSYDVGAPFVCHGEVLGLVYFIPVLNKTKSGGCYNTTPDNFYPVTTIYQDMDWIQFFIGEPRSFCLNLYSNLYLYFFVVVLFIISCV